LKGRVGDELKRPLQNAQFIIKSYLSFGHLSLEKGKNLQSQLAVTYALPFLREGLGWVI